MKKYSSCTQNMSRNITITERNKRNLPAFKKIDQNYQQINNGKVFNTMSYRSKRRIRHLKSNNCSHHNLIHNERPVKTFHAVQIY